MGSLETKLIADLVVGFLIVLFIALGYFVYGGLNGAIAIFILCAVYAIAVFLSIIPFIGIWIQYRISLDVILPWVMTFTGIYPTWLTTIIFVMYLIFGIYACGKTTIATIYKIKSRFSACYCKYGKAVRNEELTVK